MLIEVTQEDIKLGVKRHCSRCPISRAMSRAFKTQIEVSNELFWETGLDPVFNTLPTLASMWIYKYDDDLAVEPFSFEV